MNVIIRQALAQMAHCASILYPYSRASPHLVNEVINMTAITVYVMVRIAIRLSHNKATLHN